MKLFWSPDEDAPPEGARAAQRSRFGRFVGVSAAVHVLVAAAAPWLVVPSAPDERLVIRMVDFVVPEPPPNAPVSKAETKAGGANDVTPAGPAPAPRTPAPRRVASGDASPRRAAPAAKPKPSPAPAAVARADTPKAERPKAETPKPGPPRVDAPKADTAKPETPAPAPVAETSDVPPLPAPPPEDTKLAAATPKDVRGAQRAPTPVAGSPRDSDSPSAAPGGAAVPVATVAIPRGLGGTGTGTDAGIGPGAGGGTGGGQGTGLVDARDPDFGEYFRLIERRVRAAWQFPESLGGTTQTVKIGFALGPEGSLRDVRVVSSSAGTLNDSALSAMKRASPFPPLPAKFRSLAGQPLVLSFRVTIR